MVAMAVTKPHLLQIRLLDEEGREQVRVDQRVDQKETAFSTHRGPKKERKAL